jgi:hypothetical protein
MIAQVAWKQRLDGFDVVEDGAGDDDHDAFDAEPGRDDHAGHEDLRRVR